MLCLKLINKGISIIKKLCHSLPRKSCKLYSMQSFFETYNWLWRCHLWTTSKWIFLWKAWIYTVQSCSSNDRCHTKYFSWKNYQELGLESLKSRWWYKCLSCMFKIMSNEAPNYLLNLIPKSQETITTRNNNIPNYNCRTDCFKHSFFPSTLKGWFNLNAFIKT